MRAERSSFVEIGLEDDVCVRPRLFAEDGVPARTVLVDLDQARRADGEHDALAVVLAQERQQRLVHCDVRDAEVPCEKLDVRERIAGARRQNARQRWQIGDRLRQHVDTIRPEVFGTLHVGRRVQVPACKSGVQRIESGADVLPEKLVLHARELVRIARQAVEKLGVEEERAAAQLILDEQSGKGLDLAELVHRLAEMHAKPLRAPARNEAEIVQLAAVVGERELVGGEFRGRLAELGAFAGVDHPGPVSGLGSRDKEDHGRPARRFRCGRPRSG